MAEKCLTEPQSNFLKKAIYTMNTEQTLMKLYYKNDVSSTNHQDIPLTVNDANVGRECMKENNKLVEMNLKCYKV